MRFSEFMEPNNPCFILPSRLLGFIPEFQAFMTSSRADVRKGLKVLGPLLRKLEAERKETTDEEEIQRLTLEIKRVENEMQVIDVTQLVIKGLSNSVYGLEGLERSLYYRRDIAETITLTGQKALWESKTVAERHYTRANGYAGDLEVIAGDTDSIMCQLKNCELEITKATSPN